MARRADVVSMVLLVALGLAYQLPFLHHGVGLIDEGHLANAARRIAGGDVLYRDVYSVYPPASFYLVAISFQAFGASLVVVRAFHVVLTLALAIASYALARRLAPAPWAFLAASLVAATGWEAIVERCHYAHLYGVFPAAGLWLLASIGEESAGPSRRRRLLALGVVAGLTLSFRLVPFVALSAATVAYLVLRRGEAGRVVREFAWISAGGLAVVVPVLIAFAWVDAAGPFLRAVFFTSVDQYAGGGQFNLPFPALRWLPTEWTLAGFGRLFVNWEFHLPLLLYAGAALDLALALRRGRGAARADARVALRFAIAVFGAVLFLRATGRSDYYHLAPVLFPAYLLGADCLARAWSRAIPEAHHERSPLAVGALLGASLLLHQVPAAIERAIDPDGRIELMPGGVRVAESGALAALVATLRRDTRPGEPILVLPFQPVIYFLADRPNPTRYDWLFPGYLRNDTERAALIERIEASAVRTVVYSPAAIDGDPSRRLAAFEPELDRYLRRHFRPTRRIGPFVVMTRGPAPGD